MRRTLIAALLALVAVSGTWATDTKSDPPATPEATFAALEKEAEAASKASLDALRAAKSAEERSRITKELRQATDRYAERFVALAEEERHQREMVRRLKDKPFVLISISADEKKETLLNFLEKQPMPWTHWHNGSKGGLVDGWNIHYFPTIYVLDAKGVIRHRDVRGEDLDKAVTDLLGEAEKKDTP
jgi:hypothetical protein